jgi:hypothetical protein
MIEWVPEGAAYGAKSIQDLDGWEIDPMGRGECPHFDA